jgi:hypothetical protein
MDVSAGSSDDFFGVWGTGPYDVFAVGRNGMILHYDGDDNEDGVRDVTDIKWKNTGFVAPETLLTVYGSGSGDVYAAGFGTMVHFGSDVPGGEPQWRVDSSFPSDYVWDLWCSATGEVFAVGERSPDGLLVRGSYGAWSAETYNSPIGGPMQFNAVTGTSASNVFAVAADGVSAGVTGVLYHFAGTSPGTHLGPIPQSRSPYSIWCSAADEVFVAGQSSGSPWRGHAVQGTVDIGAGTVAWADPDIMHDVETLNDIWGRDADDVFATGYSGKIYHYAGSWGDISYGSQHWLDVWGCGPAADAGVYAPVPQSSPAGAEVQLDGSGSAPGAVFAVGLEGIIRSLNCDPDDLTYTWTGPFGEATGVAPTVTMPPGTHPVTLVVSNGGDASAPAEASITVVPNAPPEAKDDEYKCDVDCRLRALPPGLLANDTDAEGETLTAHKASDPQDGTVSILANGDFTYRPDPGFEGDDTFTYTAFDGKSHSEPATVTVHVVPCERELEILAEEQDLATGHWYRLYGVDEPEYHRGIGWRCARVLAEQQLREGVAGHLATITSPEESDFVLNNILTGADGWHWADQHCWIGGFQPPDSPEPNGNWQWVTGEPWDYTNWHPAEPNNAGSLGPENALELIVKLSYGRWNDCANCHYKWLFIVEYEPAVTPTEGHVTGGGHFATGRGKARFGFVCRCDDVDDPPEGELQFVVGKKAAKLHAREFEWLAVEDGIARFQGTCDVAGRGEYAFLVVARDGDPDGFRLKVWDADSGDVLFDTSPGEPDSSDEVTDLDGGQITIH